MSDKEYMTRREVSLLLGISHQAVATYEERALRKLRNHPAIRKLAEEMGVIQDESAEESEI